jgi:hypothetical protein
VEIEALRTRAVKEITNTNPLVDVLWDDDLVLLPHSEFASTMEKLTAKVDELVAAEKAAEDAIKEQMTARSQAANKKGRESWRRY